MKRHALTTFSLARNFLRLKGLGTGDAESAVELARGWYGDHSKIAQEVVAENRELYERLR